MKYVPGIDVSGWEPNIDWQAVRNSGIKFAFLKATEGIYFTDKTFAQYWAGTKSVGILRGAYHYLRGEFDANQQVDLFLKTVHFEPGDLPPVLDIENINNEKISNQEMIAKAEIWLKKVEAATGRKPIIYSGPFFLRDRMSRPGYGLPPWSKTYPIWLANYLINMTENSLPIQPAGWQDWILWQYSDKGSVPGIHSGVDMNYFRGSEADLYAFAGARPVEVISTPTTTTVTAHSVQAGDTVESIAKQYRVEVTELLKANPQLLQAGMSLKLPAGAAAPVTTPPATTPVAAPITTPPQQTVPTTTGPYTNYTVKSGDNLSVIAARYKTTVDKIVAMNGLPNANIISVGQVLKIPTA